MFVEKKKNITVKLRHPRKMRQAFVAAVLVLAAGLPAAEAFRAPTCAPLVQTRARGACGAAPAVCMRQRPLCSSATRRREAGGEA